MARVEKEYPFGSMHKTGGWESQLARVSRWLDRLMNVKSPSDAEDFLYAFFQNAHCLRDWHAGDRTTGEIDRFVNSNLVTRICRDAANVTKHHELTQRASQGRELSILREYAGTDRGWYENNSRLVIVTNYDDNGIVVDARKVARECLRLWCEFLSPHDLCDSIVSHFQFTGGEFSQALEEAERRTEWANQIMDSKQ